MTLPEEVWTAYVVTATREFQRTLISSSLTWRELSRDTIDELLRCGYVLRCVEEALS
jgi:predicted house-cleaning NTP pyrophosphatase (Maf/HAM1 superfamily)